MEFEIGVVDGRRTVLMVPGGPRENSGFIMNHPDHPGVGACSAEHVEIEGLTEEEVAAVESGDNSVRDTHVKAAVDEEFLLRDCSRLVGCIGWASVALEGGEVRRIQVGMFDEFQGLSIERQSKRQTLD